MRKLVAFTTAGLRGSVLFLARCIGALDVLGVSHNVAAVVPGVLYRSGTLPTRKMKRLIDRYGIKTVVNLRGGSGRPWHTGQRILLTEQGVDLREQKMSSQSMPSLEKMQALEALLANARTPILIHCRSGSDRTGLATAIYQLAIRKRPLAEARASLSFRYGHFPWLWSRTKAMGRALDIFAAHHAARSAEAAPGSNADIDTPSHTGQADGMACLKTASSSPVS